MKLGKFELIVSVERCFKLIEKDFGKGSIMRLGGERAEQSYRHEFEFHSARGYYLGSDGYI